MLELAIDNIGEYFVLLVTVRAKPCARSYAVLVEDSQGTPGFVTRVAIARERKCVESLKPAMVCMTPLVARTWKDL